MTLYLKRYKHIILRILLCTSCFLGFSQGETSTFKAQIGLGFNSPSSDGFVSTFQSKSVNMPTVNLGVQYMFRPKFGAKLDFGYSRFSNKDNTPAFKVNYSRINAQLVYDASRLFGTASSRIGVFPHAGLGFSFIKPLGNYPENKTSFMNLMGGVEFHFGLTDSVSLYLDTSYIYGFGDDFAPVSTGFGSFNGDLLTVSVGVSLSLSGCYYCERHE